jgi:hypothetical protein
MIKQTRKVEIKPYVKTVGAHRGGKVQIDKRLPKSDRPGIIRHEIIEDDLMKKGENYDTAHPKANKAEKKMVGAKQYKKETKDADRLYLHNIKSKNPRSKCPLCGGKCGGKCHG